MKKNVLIIAAHPDDEVLGCGGTAARLAKESYKTYSLILGEGLTARDNTRDRERHKQALDTLKKQAYAANKAIGVSDVFLYDFADNRFDSVPLLDITKIIEKVIEKVKPVLVFTHYRNDLNIDHKITYQATLTATRPLLGQMVRKVYSFEVLSSTEWSYPLNFSPDTFFDISRTINSKVEAMRRYSSEMRKFPHPRSVEGIKLNAKTWGMKTGLKYAEAFECVRVIY